MQGQYVVNIDGSTVSNPTPLADYMAAHQSVADSASTTIPFLSIGIWVAVVLGALIVFFGSFFTVEQQTVRFVERFGKFRKIGFPGFNLKVPLLDSVSEPFDMRLQQLTVEVETKSRDNVFVTTVVAVQYEVIPEKAYEAYYKLQDPKKQITAYVFDTVRAQVPKLTLDEVFEKKDDIAVAVKTELDAVMATFGYTIEKALVTDISPAENVRIAMNNINAAQRNQQAAGATAEANKIILVKNAEAEAESKKLQGVGIANERTAIVEGLKTSVETLKDALGTAVTEEQVMNILMLTQYFDTLKSIGTHDGANTIMLPSGADGMATIMAALKTTAHGGN